MTESGSLFQTYEITYRFSNGGIYTATLQIVAGYPFVLFSEQMENNRARSWQRAIWKHIV